MHFPDPDEPEAGEDLAIRGEVETTSIPELLRTLLSSGETGLLVVREGMRTKSVYVLNGRVVFAASNDPDERLGEMLLVRGKITARQYVEASKQIRPGRRLGVILIEMSALEPDDLVPSVEHQVREILLELLDWSHGEYEFIIKELDVKDLITLNLPTENLILEGVRRSRSWGRILRGIGGLDSILVPTGSTEGLVKLDLSEDEQEVLSHLNGRSTVDQICEVSYLPSFETCRALWAFRVLGLARLGGAGEAAAAGERMRERERELDLEEIVEKFNQMFGRIYTFLRGRVGDGVDEFMDRALDEVSRQYGALFGGVDLKSYGRADFDQMLANVADLPAEQRKSLMVSGLNELVFVMQLAVKMRMGAEDETVVMGIIKDGFRRIGTA